MIILQNRQNKYINDIYGTLTVQEITNGSVESDITNINETIKIIDMSGNINTTGNIDTSGNITLAGTNSILKTNNMINPFSTNPLSTGQIK